MEETPSETLRPIRASGEKKFLCSREFEGRCSVTKLCMREQRGMDEGQVWLKRKGSSFVYLRFESKERTTHGVLSRDSLIVNKTVWSEFICKRGCVRLV